MVLRPDLGGYPSKDIRFSSTCCECHILFWTLQLPRMILDRVPEVLGKPRYFCCHAYRKMYVTSASVSSHHRLPRLKSHVGALHDFTLVQAETAVSMCENVPKSVQMHAGLPQTRQIFTIPAEVVVRWYKRGVLPAFCSNHLINLT